MKERGDKIRLDKAIERHKRLDSDMKKAKILANHISNIKNNRISNQERKEADGTCQCFLINRLSPINLRTCVTLW